MNYFHPERMPSLPARRRAAARRQLEDMVVRSRRSRRRRRPVMIAAAAAVVVTISVAAGVIASQPVTNKSVARCYSVAKPDAGPAYYTTVKDAGKPGTKAQVRNARNECAALFQIGVLQQGHRIVANPARRSYPVPNLEVCVWHHGTAVVFPGPVGTCATLGLPRAAARRLSGSRRLRPGAAAPVL
jgi:hypothetical protein